MPTDTTYACFVMHCKYCKDQLGTPVVHLAERVHAGGGGAVRLLAQAVDFQLVALSSFSETRLHHILRCQCAVIGQGYTAHHRGPRAREQYYRLQESRQVVQSWPSAAATSPTGYETLSGSGNYILLASYNKNDRCCSHEENRDWDVLASSFCHPAGNYLRIGFQTLGRHVLERPRTESSQNRTWTVRFGVGVWTGEVGKSPG